MINIIREKLIEAGISDVDKIIEIVSDFLPDKKKKNVSSLLRFIEKLYQKKYGEDEIFVSFPISAKFKIKISEFKKRNLISYDEYCKFGEWLIECSNEDVTIWKLIDQRLYNKFKVNYTSDKNIIEEKKKINNHNLLRI